jgi:hypothetical protein
LTVKRIVANIAAKEVGSGPAYQIKILIKILVLNLALEFFQECDLAGMVKLMLRDAAEHIVKIVIILSFAGHSFRQA